MLRTTLIMTRDFLLTARRRRRRGPLRDGVTSRLGRGLRRLGDGRRRRRRRRGLLLQNVRLFRQTVLHRCVPVGRVLLVQRAPRVPSVQRRLAAQPGHLRSAVRGRLPAQTRRERRRVRRRPGGVPRRWGRVVDVLRRRSSAPHDLLRLAEHWKHWFIGYYRILFIGRTQRCNVITWPVFFSFTLKKKKKKTSRLELRGALNTLFQDLGTKRLISYWRCAQWRDRGNFYAC